MVKREEREKSDHKGQRVLRELYQPKKYIECIFKWDHYFLFPIWSHINLKRSNQDGHEKRRPFNMVKKEEKERRMTNKGQIVLRELYQPKYIECIFKWVSIFPFQIWSHINFEIDTMTNMKKKDDHPIWSRKRREEERKRERPTRVKECFESPIKRKIHRVYLYG